MGNELSKTPKGDLVIAAEKLGKFRGLSSEKLHLSSLLDDLLVSAHTQPGQRLHPFLYGDLRFLHVAEIVALINSMQKDGSLTIIVPLAQKVIFFSGGEVVYATSTVEDYRLGEVLWRRGFISLEQLSSVYDLVGPKKLGAILLQRGLITPRQLYEGVKEQVLEILYSTFHITTGEFLFTEGKVTLHNAVRLDLTTREIIREGARRAEEMSRLEELFPDRQTIPVVRPLSVEAKLSSDEQRLKALVDGKKSVAAILSESRMPEYEALKILARLHQRGFLDTRAPEAGKPGDEVPIRAALEIYARMLRYIHQTLLAEEPGVENRLEGYLGSPLPQHSKVFQGVAFDSAGQLDIETLLRNAEKLHPKDARELALAAVRGLYDYALFQAMDVLDEAASDLLLEKIEVLSKTLPDTETKP
jgi:hypothetical protein